MTTSKLSLEEKAIEVWFAAQEQWLRNGEVKRASEPIVQALQEVYNNLNNEIKKLNEQLSRIIELDRQHCNRLQDITEERDELRERLGVAVEALEFYAERMNYSVDYDTSQAGTSRRVILYSDQEEINEATIIAGKRAREALKTVNKGIKKE